MARTQITSQFQVSAQPQITEFNFLSGAGITLIINNRPDGEDSEQPGNTSESEAVRGAGMDYRHLPVTLATFSEADIRIFQGAIFKASGPVLAHCKTGTRSLSLWVLGEVLDGRMAAADVIPFGKRFGFDLTSAALWLVKRDEKSAK